MKLYDVFPLKSLNFCFKYFFESQLSCSLLDSFFAQYADPQRGELCIMQENLIRKRTYKLMILAL